MKMSFITVFFFIVFIVDLEVPEFVGIMSCSHNSKPISQVVLLEVLLRQVLEVSLAKLDVRIDDQLRLGSLDRNVAAQVSCLAFNLDLIQKVLLLQNGNQL